MSGKQQTTSKSNARRERGTRSQLSTTAPKMFQALHIAPGGHIGTRRVGAWFSRRWAIEITVAAAWRVGRFWRWCSASSPGTANMRILAADPAVQLVGSPMTAAEIEAGSS